MSVLLKIEGVFYSAKEFAFFKKNKDQKDILKDISFVLQRNEVLGIVGESGSGKTTLAKIICGIIKPDKGSIVYNNTSTNKKKNSTQILFQNSNELINPLRKVGDLLNEAFNDKKKLEKICSLLNIPNEQFNKVGYQLSGGERQRIGLARILSAEPEILILDEPFSAQDHESQNNFLELFRKIKNELDITIICISHDINLISQFAHNLIVLFGGKIMEFGNITNITKQHRHPYTRFLIKAVNYELDEKIISDDVGALNDNISCPYFLRCGLRTEKCKKSIEIIKSDGLITYCNNPI